MTFRDDAASSMDGSPLTELLLGRIALEDRDTGGAKDLLARARAGLSEMGDSHGAAAALALLGRTHAIAGEYAEADLIQKQAYEDFRDLGDGVSAARSLEHRAQIAQDNGRTDEAHSLFSQALEVFSTLSARDAARVRLRLESVARLRQGPGELALCILPSNSSAARAATRWAKGVLCAWALDQQLRDDVGIVLAECVAHAAVRGVGDVVACRLTRSLHSQVRIEVNEHIRMAAPAVRQPRDERAEPGRGLELVDCISQRWGCRDPQGESARSWGVWALCGPAAS
jgi:hypothetical protein